MAYTTSCDGACPLPNGDMITLVVQQQSDDDFSRIYRVTEMIPDVVPVQSELLAVNDWLTSICCNSPDEILAVGDTGEAHHFSQGAWTVRRVSDRALTFVQGFGGKFAIAVGDAGIVYCWDGSVWSALSPPLGEKLFGVSGTSIEDLVVCGNHGGLWFRQQSGWQKTELGTNVRFTSVLSGFSGLNWVCGIGGSLFAGREDEWTEVLAASHDLHGLAEMGGVLFVAGGAVGVCRLEGNVLSVIKSTVISYGLSSSDRYLASHGDKIGIRFDGNKWAGVRYG